MGPASTDFVVGRGEPHTGPRIEQAPTDLDRKLAGPPLEALDRFLEAWWGLSIGGASSDFDSALDEIRRVNAEHSIWRWDRLAGPGERIDGPGCELVLVVEGQQGYTAWAYDPIDHCGYVYDDMDSSWHSAGHPVSELLLQSVICAVMEAAPANALCELSRSSVQVEGVLDDFSPVRPPIGWLGPSSPSTQLLTNGTVLVAQTGSNVHIAAHDRSAVAHSSLARTGAWVWVG